MRSSLPTWDAHCCRRLYASEQCSDRSPLHDVRQQGLRSGHATVTEPKMFLCGRVSKIWFQIPPGGARRDRTDDLLLAKQALSQLSYGPFQRTEDGRRRTDKSAIRRLSSVFRRLILVGLGRFELPTSRLSSARSNQLSYKPLPGISDQSSVIRKT
jgi:hypothetical protein